MLYLCKALCVQYLTYLHGNIWYHTSQTHADTRRSAQHTEVSASMQNTWICAQLHRLLQTVAQKVSNRQDMFGVCGLDTVQVQSQLWTGFGPDQINLSQSIFSWSTSKHNILSLYQLKCSKIELFLWNQQKSIYLVYIWTYTHHTMSARLYVHKCLVAVECSGHDWRTWHLWLTAAVSGLGTGPDQPLTTEILDLSTPI